MSRWRVTVKAECEMTVEVRATSMREAEAKARAGDYDPYTDWTPIDYGTLRAVNPRPAPQREAES